MVPVNSAIIQLIDPGVQVAVDRAIHDTHEERFHKRITGVCPYCLTLGEKLSRAFRENVADSAIFAEASERIRQAMAAQDEMYAEDA